MITSQVRSTSRPNLIIRQLVDCSCLFIFLPSRICKKELVVDDHENEYLAGREEERVQATFCIYFSKSMIV